MNKTLKEIYGYDFIENPETSLLKDVNRILNKTPDELDVHDVCVLIRQEMFLDTSIPKAVEMINNDPSVGDNYDYCLLYNLAHMESSMTEFKKLLSSLVENLESKFETVEFELDSDKEDCCESINLLKGKIGQ